MAAAIPWVVSNLPTIATGLRVASMAKGLWDAFHSPKPPPMPAPPPTLSAEEAERRARAVYEPLYQQYSQQLLEQLDKQALARGLFGQAPAEAYKTYRAQQLAAQQAADIANLKEQLIGQSEEAARQQQQLAMQYAMNNWNTQLANQVARTNALIAGMQAGIQGLRGISELFPSWWSQTFGRPLERTLSTVPAAVNQGQNAALLGNVAGGTYRLSPDLNLQGNYLANPYGR